MAFNSSIFILGFIVFYFFYSLPVKNANYRVVLLLLFNLVFYYFLSGKGIVILLLLGISDFFIAQNISKTPNELYKKIWLYLSIGINISFILLFRHIGDWFELKELPYWPSVIGISFFVFRSMGYVLDVHREIIEEPEKSLIHYLTYLSFFPLIMAGPISPSRDFLPQLKAPFSGNSIAISSAFFLIASGIVKNYIISNYIASNFVNRVFDSPAYFSGLEILIATIGQALVVYTDFSGYTDMMVGISMLLGFEIAANFNFPYISANITEYWRRWHMSLSKWLNEYLFFPLSFLLRKWKITGTVLAVFITFIISGFWHGTAAHYTFWGMLHGIALSWDVISGNMRDKWRTFIPKWIYFPISIFLTFMFLSFSGIFFKSHSIEDGFLMLEKIFTRFNPALFPAWLQSYTWVFVGMCAVLLLQFTLFPFYQKIYAFFGKIHFMFSAILLAMVIFIAYQISALSALPFIYLEF
ncbi:MAG: MBOAT family protein [Bacteroidia bacterium]|nr:MBOAT family protein [Bacteroidia bacterium]